MPPIIEISEPSVNWNYKKVFKEEKGEIYIGGEKIKPELRKLLKEQATYLESSQLFEIIVNTIRDESVNMALKDSKEWNHVLSAKMLFHWGFVFESLISSLKK